MTTYMKQARRAAIVVAALAMVAGEGRAQGIAERVARARDGQAEIRFAARDGVCGDGRSFIRMGNSFYGTMSDNWSRQKEQCMPGPVRVVLRVANGAVGDVRTYVGGGATPEGAVTDLGEVPAREAAAWLLQLARRGEARSDQAILGAVLADSATVWPELLAIARDDDASRKTRREAMHWLGRFASAKQAGHPDQLWSDDDEKESPEVETKKSAVFALSQLRGGAGVEPLLTVARTNREPAVRSQAMFWLSQTDDRRAVDLFEEILKK